MYTAEEASALRQEFWTKFGIYMLPVPSARGEKVNWVNYKTGVKPIRFRMDAYKKEAFVAIEIRAAQETRKALYQHFLTEKASFPPQYEWIEDAADEHGKPLSRIYIELNGYAILNKNHWPELISFFKTNMLFLDSIWAEQKDIFELLANRS